MTNVVKDKGEDAASIFARHFVATKYADIPGEVVDAVKKSVLDTLGVSIAASSLAPDCRKLVELAKEAGGREESTILAFGGRVPAWMAAFVNGGMVHSLDLDDIHHEGVSHPSGVVIPAAFAIGERAGPTSGRDFITAIALGHDMVMRMTSALRWDPQVIYNWVRYAVVGVFGGAATCGKLLGLKQHKIHAAIGAALCYSAGTFELLDSSLRGLYDGWAAKGSVFAALMAEKGITGPACPLEGEKGFFNVYYRGEYDRDVLLADLGKKFYGTYIGYKVWASCGNTHVPVNAFLGLVQEHALGPKDIEEITVFIGTHARPQCEPLEDKRKPKTIIDAKFSVPFVMALAGIRRSVAPGDFTLKSIRDPELLEFAQRVVPILDPKLDVQRGVPRAIVEIRTKAGKKYSRRADYAYGHYRDPMNMKAIIDKFRDCVSYSIKPLPQESVDRAVNMVSELEEVDDVGEIIRLLG